MKWKDEGVTVRVESDRLRPNKTPFPNFEDFDSTEAFVNALYDTLVSPLDDSPDHLEAAESAVALCKLIYPPFKPKPFKPKKASNKTENAEPCQSPQDTSQ